MASTSRWLLLPERNHNYLKKVDYIIVGQGIAGTFLSWFLMKNGKTFFVIDDKKESSASNVAAGIIHPITGRRIVKTWMADTLLPFAHNAYQAIETHFNQKIFHPLPVLELLSSVKEYNDWITRSEELSSYIESSDVGSVYDDVLNQAFKKIIIKQSSWIDIGTLLRCFRNYFLKKNILLEEKFDINLLKLTDERVEYKNNSSEKIIFCEGVEALKNPFWRHLPFIPAKGEMLTIRAEMKLDHIINRKIYILPIGENLFKVGSTYTWKFQNELPSSEAKDFLVTQIKSILGIPFEIIEHKAAIRPTVKNRRPFLGLHQQHKQVAIFNGLGTKGCLLAPYFANHLTDFLIGKGDLMDEVNVGMLAK